MDRGDLDAPAAREVCDELNALVRDLSARGVAPSGWYGNLEPLDQLAGWERANRGPDYEPLPGAADDDRYPWFLYWEISWLVAHCGYESGQRVLDLGGSASLFSCLLASRGLEVLTIDLNEQLTAHGDRIAASTGWMLTNLRRDMRFLDPAELGRFDHVTSVCVFEHLPLAGRIDAGRQIHDLLEPGGRFSITFDYLNPSANARIDSPEAVEEQFVQPSGLSVRGNARFFDNGLRYLLHPFHAPGAEAAGWKRIAVASGQFGDHPPERGDYTFGALFQQRPAGPAAAPTGP